MEMGIPFTGRPKALRFDYKVYNPGTGILTRASGSGVKTSPGQDNAEAAFWLEQERGILTRCGLHCAPSAHKTLGTFPQGTVRFSPGWFTTEAEIDAAVGAVRELAAK